MVGHYPLLVEVEEHRRKLLSLVGAFDERSRRLVLAAEAQALRWGGIELVHRATGFSRPTLARGIRELTQPTPSAPSRVRRPVGGRKRRLKQPAGIGGALVLEAPPRTPYVPTTWLCRSGRVRGIHAQPY